MQHYGQSVSVATEVKVATRVTADLQGIFLVWGSNPDSYIAGRFFTV